MSLSAQLVLLTFALTLCLCRCNQHDVLSSGKNKTCPNHEAEREDWDDLTEDEISCLISKGWDEDSWECGWQDEEYLSKWSELTSDQQAHLVTYRWTEETWDKAWDDPCERDPRTSSMDDFPPIKVKIDAPEIQNLTMDKLGTIYEDVNIRLVSGGYHSENFLGERSLGEFISGVKEGDTRYYVHLEESMEEKRMLQEGIGNKILGHLKNAISSNPILRERNIWNKEFDDFDEDLFDWAMFVGAKNAQTSMHYDDDLLNFLYLVEGKKRIVIIPNDNITDSMYDVQLNEDQGTGWVNEDILDPNFNLPESAADLIIEAGEGIAIPYLAWHAVENLEPSTAFSLRVIEA